MRTGILFLLSYSFCLQQCLAAKDAKQINLMGARVNPVSPQSGSLIYMLIYTAKGTADMIKLKELEM